MSQQTSYVHGTLNLQPFICPPPLQHPPFTSWSARSPSLRQRQCQPRASDGMCWSGARASKISRRGVLVALLKASAHCQGTCRECIRSVYTRAPRASLYLRYPCLRIPMTLPSIAPPGAGTSGSIPSHFAACSACGGRKRRIIRLPLGVERLSHWRMAMMVSWGVWEMMGAWRDAIGLPNPVVRCFGFDSQP